MGTTKIEVTACDNELILLATRAGMASVELCHISSGYNDPVEYAVNPASVLPAGDYTLTMIGINWGGPSAFTVTLTTNGVQAHYSAPQNYAVGVTWTNSVPMTVAAR